MTRQDTPPAEPSETLATFDARTLDLKGEGPRELVISLADGVSVVRLPRDKSLTIGRVRDADIFASDPTISRTHAILHVGEDLELEDLGSMNGTRVAGAVVAPGSRIAIHEGVPFELGSATFVVLRARASTTHTIPAPGAVSLPEADDKSPVVVDPATKRVFGLLEIIGPAELNVIVLGETGTGKEVFAGALHASSSRASKPFLHLNCAALPESVLEGELFGYERGSFTGAVQAKAGLFESADGGTILLDEIGDMPLSVQSKILRVLETGDVLRIGSVKPRRIDVRMISATHKDLRREVAAGNFRADLFFRINGISVTLPPLRERPADLRPLAERFARLAAAKASRRVLPLTDATIDRLANHSWPGNVRELRNVIERAVVMARGTSITPDCILIDEPMTSQAIPSFSDGMVPSARHSEVTSVGLAYPDLASPPAPPSADQTSPALRPLKEALDLMERDRILDALNKCGGNQSRAGRLLGISRYTLMARMDRHGISRPRKT